MKIAKSLSDARKWANSFTASKRWTAVKCEHGNPTVIEILEKEIVVDKVMVCSECWDVAKWVDKIQ
jgi:hypothetical protein